MEILSTNKYINLELDVYFLSSNPSITPEIILGLDFPWNMDCLSENPMTREIETKTKIGFLTCSKILQNQVYNFLNLQYLIEIYYKLYLIFHLKKIIFKIKWKKKKNLLL